MRAAMKKIGIVLVILGAMLVPTLPASAAPQAKTTPAVEQAIHDMFAVHEFSQVAISPNGSRLAWVESLNAKNGAPSPNSAIYASDWKTGGAPQRITAARGGAVAAENDVVWSPGGRRLRF